MPRSKTLWASLGVVILLVITAMMSHGYQSTHDIDGIYESPIQFSDFSRCYVFVRGHRCSIVRIDGRTCAPLELDQGDIMNHDPRGYVVRFHKLRAKPLTC